MDKLSPLSTALQQVLVETAENHGRSSGFVQRRSKLTASGFVESVVFGWMADRQASRAELAQMAGIGGVAISAEAISQRFSPAAVSLLQSVLASAVTQRIGAEATDLALLRRFAGVWLFDTTTVALPSQLAQEYRGCGHRSADSAGVKLHVGFELLSGRIAGPQITAAREHDRCSQIVERPVDPGALVIRDLGYFKLDEFARFTEQGVWWLTRLKNGIHLYDETGRAIDLHALINDQQQLDIPVSVGRRHLAARLLLKRCSQQQAEKRRRSLRRTAKRHGSTPSAASLALCAYTIAITNVEATMLSLAEAMTLLRARWQVEILFKLWKSHGQIDQWQSRRPVAILCELYAKLIGLLVEHWILLHGAWQQADRSIFKAAKVVAQAAMMLAAAITDTTQLCHVLQLVIRSQANASSLSRRRLHPSTFQQLDAFS